MEEIKYLINNQYTVSVLKPRNFDCYPVIRILVGEKDKSVCFELYRERPVAYMIAFRFDPSMDLVRNAMVFMMHEFPALEVIDFKYLNNVQSASVWSKVKQIKRKRIERWQAVMQPSIVKQSTRKFRQFGGGFQRTTNPIHKYGLTQEDAVY